MVLIVICVSESVYVKLKKDVLCMCASCCRKLKIIMIESIYMNVPFAYH